MVRLNSAIIAVLLLPLVSTAFPTAANRPAGPGTSDLAPTAPIDNAPALVRRSPAGKKTPAKSQAKTPPAQKSPDRPEFRHLRVTSPQSRPGPSLSGPSGFQPPDRPPAPVNTPGRPQLRRVKTWSGPSTPSASNSRASSGGSSPRLAPTPPDRPTAPVNAPGTPPSPPPLGRSRSWSASSSPNPNTNQRALGEWQQTQVGDRPPSRPDALPRFDTPGSGSIAGAPGAGSPTSNPDRNMRETDKEPVEKLTLGGYKKAIFGAKRQGPPPPPGGQA